MNKETAKALIENKFTQTVKVNPNIHNAYLLIHSDLKQIHWNLAAGQTDQTPAHPDQVYHAASIGKTFTSTILAMLQEKGLINFDDPITKYLPPELLKDLHTYKNTDYTQHIQVKHLLSHTSGLPHFAEEKPKNGPTFLEMAIENPSRFWTPQETIGWSKEHLKPHFPPGRGCFYSETGYNLLGLIIENITAKPYHEALHHYLFTPLKMNHSYLSQYSKPAQQSPHPHAYAYLKNQQVSFEDYPSFSAFYASGQTANTSEDLLKFMKALVENKLINAVSLTQMQQWHKMWMGIDYGYGLMRVRTLPLTKKYNGFGHMGSIGSYMFYYPALDTYLIANFNQTLFVRTGMTFILAILRTVAKVN